MVWNRCLPAVRCCFIYGCITTTFGSGNPEFSTCWCYRNINIIRLCSIVIIKNTAEILFYILCIYYIIPSQMISICRNLSARPFFSNTCSCCRGICSPHMIVNSASHSWSKIMNGCYIFPISRFCLWQRTIEPVLCFCLSFCRKCYVA